MPTVDTLPSFLRPKDEGLPSFLVPRSESTPSFLKPKDSGIGGSYKALWTAIGDFAKPTQAEDVNPNDFAAKATSPEIVASITNLAKLPFSMTYGIGEQVGGAAKKASDGDYLGAGEDLLRLGMSMVPGQLAARVLRAHLDPTAVEERQRLKEELRGQEWAPALDLLALGGILKAKLPNPERASVGRLAFDRGEGPKIAQESNVNTIRRGAENQPLALPPAENVHGEGFQMRPARPGEVVPDAGPAATVPIESNAVVPSGVRKVRYVKAKDKYVAMDKDGKALAVYDDLASVPEALHDKLDAKAKSQVADFFDQPKVPEGQKAKTPLWMKDEQAAPEANAPQWQPHEVGIMQDKLDQLQLETQSQNTEMTLAEYDKLTDEQKKMVGRPTEGYDTANLDRKGASGMTKYRGKNKSYSTATGDEGMQFDYRHKPLTMSTRHDMTALTKALNGEPLTEAQKARVQSIVDEGNVEVQNQIEATKLGDAKKAEIAAAADAQRAQPKIAGDLEPGQKIDVNGEAFRVIDKTPESVTLKDGKTIKLDYFDKVPGGEPILGIDKTPAGDQVSFGGQHVVPETPITKVGRRVKDVQNQSDVFHPDKTAPGNMAQDQGDLLKPKSQSYELGMMATPQVAIDLGENVVKAMKAVSDATSKAVQRKVEDLTESGGVGGETARATMIEHHKNWRDLQFQLDDMGRVYKKVVPEDRWQLVWDATQQYGRADLQAKLTPV